MNLNLLQIHLSSGLENNKACIKDKCLFLKQGKVYRSSLDKSGLDKERKLVDIPFQVNAIGKTETFWLLANSKERDEKNLKIGEKKVNAEVYAYDGKKYVRLVGKEFFKSDYIGQFLLGGTDEEFIAGFYGFGSKILRFKQEDCVSRSMFSFLGFDKLIDNLNSCYSSQDVSYWFSSRLARVKDIDFLEYDSHYIFYSKTEPFFGITDNNFLMDLTSELKFNDFKKVLAKRKEDKIFLSAHNKNGKEEYFDFKFLGFDKSKTVSWVSSNLVKKEVLGAAITSYTGSKDGGDIKFYFSNNGNDWINADPGKNVYFAGAKGDELGLYWRVDLISDAKDDFASPFLGQVSMSYAK